MKVKTKISEWSTGRPIIILNRETAKKLSAHVGDRVMISSNSEMIVATLDLSSKLTRKNQAIVSTEIVKYLKLKNNKTINIEIAKNPRVTQTLNKKLRCEPLSKKQIYNIIKSIVTNSLTEIEIAFFISSIYKCGMTLEETAYLTEAIFKTGKKLKLKNKIVVDKHCIGGIAGNRTTPIVVSICAAQGLMFPKTSSRAITSASGTADTMESVCKVEFTKKELEKILKKTNACLVWGGNLGFAPADEKIIRIEKIIHLDPEPNLLASIMAKKLAAGSTHILIDIPYGKSAKVSHKQAINLKQKFEKLAKRFKLKIKVVLTPGSQPIGNGVGPVLEIRDILSVLEGKGPEDLRKKSIFLAGELLELARKSKKGNGKALAEEILNSGKALNKFLEIIKAQGADLKKLDSKLTLAKLYYKIKAPKNFKIKQINNKQINLLARILGSPKDKKAGVYIHKHVGQQIKKNQPLLTLYSSSKHHLQDAKIFYKENKIIS
ncbi:MAG: thymidine phosphorylase [Nanoarchaeota archaeon]|nr:thymidine phosphorylase [Nanoarchaeota archaeon]